MVASLLFGAALGVGGWWLTRQPEEAVALAPLPAPENGAVLFEQVYRYIATQYVDSVPLDSLYRKAVAGLVTELNDPYSAFLPETRARRLAEQISGEYGGVGVQLDVRDGRALVIEPVPGAPAERAGVQVGDHILSVGGEPTAGLQREEVARMLRGEPGSTIAVELERFGVHRLSLKLTRQSVTLRSVPRVVMLERDVGYVDVNSFSANTAAELSLALDSLKRLGARSVVLDLRGNPGGLLEQGVAVAELFLDSAKRIVELRGRPGTAPEAMTDKDPQPWPNVAVAVLVDGNSASASEIVAGALQDHDRAIVVGRTSYGKGSAQSVFPMTTGGALRITTSRWYTPLGRSISLLADSTVAESGPRADTVRPRFTTPMGRTVFGGGGIVPDVVAGDSTLPKEVQALVRALGPNTVQYRNAVSNVALAFKQRGALTEPLQPVTRDMVAAVWNELVSRKVTIDRAVFDAAAPWIARALGYEVARVTFGADAEFLRRAQDDAVIARAVRLLNGVSSPREPFARAEDPSIIVPARTPTLDN